MSNTKDPAFWIGRVPDLQSLGDREKNVLAAVCEVGSYPVNSTVIQQGGRPAVVPLLVEGQVEAIYVTPNRKNVTFTVLSPPEIVGFLWFLDAKLRSPLAFQASQPSICLNIRTLDLENLYKSGNQLSYPILATLYRRAASQFRLYNDCFKQMYEAPDETYMKLIKLMSEGN
jgi:CRP-like cAMP-binding protein